MEAHAAKDWSQVRRLMIDETSARRGHRYVTVVLDAESHDLLLMVEGRRMAGPGPPPTNRRSRYLRFHWYCCAI